MKRKYKNSKDKWAWATPEKLNPESRKHHLQGAVILICLGAVLLSLGIFLAVKFNTTSFEKFTGLENTIQNRQNHSFLMFFFNSPWIIGGAMIIGGARSIAKQYFPHLF